VPELPEVEVTRRGLAPHLPGHVIVGVWCGPLSLRQALPEAALRRYVAGRRVVELIRRGKYLRLMLENGAMLILHLGMSGRLRLDNADALRRRHDHLELQLDSGLLLRLNDARRFGLVAVWPPESVEEQVAWQEKTLGPEPLEPDISASVLRRIGGRSHRSVKNLLLEGRMVAGVGNIYACESLFVAGIHPATPGCELIPGQWRKLAQALPRVLRAAIAAGGTTIADFLGVGGQPGYFQLELMVYGRSGRPCRVCGQPVEKIVQAGRSSFFCPRCQP